MADFFPPLHLPALCQLIHKNYSVDAAVSPALSPTCDCNVGWLISAAGIVGEQDLRTGQEDQQVYITLASRSLHCSLARSQMLLIGCLGNITISVYTC